MSTIDKTEIKDQMAISDMSQWKYYKFHESNVFFIGNQFIAWFSEFKIDAGFIGII